MEATLLTCDLFPRQVRAAVRNAGGARGAAAAVTDDAIAMFSTELCGRLPNAAAAAAAAVAAAAPEADAASGSDVSAVPAAATGSTFRLRLADSVTGIDDLSNAAASGEEDEVAADDGGLTFVVSAAANMNGLFFQVRPWYAGRVQCRENYASRSFVAAR